MIASCSENIESGAINMENHCLTKELRFRNTTNPLVSIIILVHNQLDYTRICIDSILAYTKERYELILVDNGSDEETQAYLQNELPQQVPENCLKVIRSEENLGFSKGNNQGLSIAIAPYLLLLNNDVVVTPGWLTGLIECAEKFPQAGIVGPMTNKASGPQVLSNVGYDAMNLEGLFDFASQRSTQFKGQAKPYWRVVGFCMLVKRTVVERIGGLDDRYGLGNFEDDDYNIRSAIAGFESWLALDVFVHHFGSRTFNGAEIDMKESLHTNWSIFKEKWSIQEALKYGSGYNLQSIVSQSFQPELHMANLPIVPSNRIIIQPNSDSNFKRLEVPHAPEVNQQYGPEDAIETLLKHLAKKPVNALIINDLGVMHSKLGHSGAALDCYRRAFELCPQNMTIVKNYADLLFVDYGDLEAAMELYVKVLQLNPEDCDCLLATGHICAAIGQTEDAVKFYERIRQIDPGHRRATEAFNQIIGASWEEISNSKQSLEKKYDQILGGSPGVEEIPKLEAFANKNPEFSQVFNDLGALHTQAGHSEKAANYYTQAVKLEPTNTTFLKNLADHLFVMDGNLTAATKLYTRVLGLHDEDSEALYALARISSSVGDKEGVAIFLNRIKQFDSAVHFPDSDPTIAKSMTSVQPGELRADQSESRDQNLIPNVVHSDQVELGNGKAEDTAPHAEVTLYLIAGKDLSLTARRLAELSEHGEHNRLCVVLSEEPIVPESDSMDELHDYIDDEDLIFASKDKLSTELNTHIKLDTNPYVAILWDDVWTATGWMNRMVEHLIFDPSAAIVGTISNIATGRQHREFDTDLSYETFGAESLDWRASHNYQRISVSTMSEFCVVFSKTMMAQVGYFDPQLPLLNAAIKDLCIRTKMAGNRTIIAVDTLTYRKNVDSDREDQQLILTKKWNHLIRTDPEWKRKIEQLKLSEAVQRKYYQKGLAEAIALASYEIDLDDMENLLLTTLVELCLDCGQFEEAEGYCVELLDKSDDSRSLAIAGVVEMGLGNTESAELIANKALLRDSRQAGALNLKGELAANNNENKYAIECFKKAVEADRGYGDPLANMGTMIWEEDPGEAFELYYQAFKLAPYKTDIVELFQSAVGQIGCFDEVLPGVAEAIDRYPAVRLLRYIEIEFLLRSEQIERAMSKVVSVLCEFPLDHKFLKPALNIREQLDAIQVNERQIRTPTLALCMIVKNEEANIVKCIASITGLVDEIVVVDTGSDDATVSLAKIMGAKVSHHKWKDDFAEARNVYLQRAKSDWILVLDADEVISKRDHRQLRQYIETEDKEQLAYVIITRNYDFNSTVIGWCANKGEYPGEEMGTGWIPTDKARLFPNNAGISYSFPVHEIVEPSLKENGFKLIKIDVPVHHYGKLNFDKTKKKYEIYYQLGVQKLKETGENPYALRELAIQAGLLKKHEESIELWNRFIKLMPDIPEAYVNLSSAYARLGKYQEAFKTAEQAYRLNPKYREAVYNYTLAAIHVGNLEVAFSIGKVLLEKYSDYNPGLLLYACVCFARDEQGKGESALKLLRKTHLWPVIKTSFESMSKSLLDSGMLDFSEKILKREKMWMN